MTVADPISGELAAPSPRQRMRATWNGAVLAESTKTVVVEGNHYFAIDDVRRELLSPSDTHTTCHWKGVASYYDVVVGGAINADAAWFYPVTSKAAERIKGMVAFWHGVTVEPVADGQ